MNKNNVKKIIIAAAVIAGFSLFGVVVSADNKVSCVDDFSSSEQTSKSIILSWNKGINADGYVIYRADRTTDGRYNPYTELNSSDITKFMDINVAPAMQYSYQIRSYNGDGSHRSYSKAETVNTAASPVDTKGLQVASQNEKSISLKWTRSEGATGYTVYRSDSKSGKYNKICDVQGSEKYSDKGLTPSHYYSYYVAAYKEVDGKRSYSGKDTAVETATSPSQVQNLETIVKKTNSLTISWDESANASGYVVYRMSNNENEYEGEWVYDENAYDYVYKSNVGKYVKYAVIKDGKKTTYTNKNLNEQQAYSYRVVPYFKSNGKYYYGDYRQVSTGTVTETPEIEVFSRDKRVMAKWYPIDGADGYAFYMSESKNGPYKLQGTTDDTVYLTKQLTVNKKYYVRVCAYYVADDGKTKVYSNYKTEDTTCTTGNRVYKYNVPDTYIEIDLDMQHMWYYEKGKLVVSTPVVTGLKYGRDTTTGLFDIFNKESPARLVGETWDTYVNYWLAVTYDGIGIHDSTWRADYEYGGDTYTYDGSHGCINTPYDKVEEMYEKVKVGTPVVIYQKSEDTEKKDNSEQ